MIVAFTFEEFREFYYKTFEVEVDKTYVICNIWKFRCTIVKALLYYRDVTNKIVDELLSAKELLVIYESITNDPTINDYYEYYQRFVTYDYLNENQVNDYAKILQEKFNCKLYNYYHPDISVYIPEVSLFLSTNILYLYAEKIFRAIRKISKTVYGFISETENIRTNICWPFYDDGYCVYCDDEFTWMYYVSEEGITFVGKTIVELVKKITKSSSKFWNVLDDKLINSKSKNHDTLQIFKTAYNNDLPYALNLIERHDSKIEVSITLQRDLRLLMKKKWPRREAKKFWEFMIYAVDPKLIDINFLVFLANLGIDPIVIASLQSDVQKVKEYQKYLLLPKGRGSK